MPIRTALRRTMTAALLASLVMGTVATPAFAGKSGGSITATVKVANGVFGGTTTATAGPSAATWVRALCYQNGKLVYEQYRQFDTTRKAVLQLGPTPSWASGAASCTAQDGYWRNGSTWRVTSTSTFSVAAA